MSKLHLGETSGGKTFDLPPDAVTQTFGILAKRGVGKTYTASVLAEELLIASLPVVIIDPLDVWWGLRAAAGSLRGGLPIIVLGGSHGDLPLESSAGSIIADLVVEERISAVLSLRHMSKNEQRRFVADFAERVYDRKGEDRYRQPLHIMIDEADAFVPQRVFSGQERMVGAIDDLVRRGRASGIGVTLITQRAAVINKDVLTQIEVLVALRTISPQDRKALEAWIEAHDAQNQRQEFMASLASLPIGTAWFWSPGWLDVFERVKVRTRKTFDSSATPKIGGHVETPKRLADVDLDLLRERLAATIEKAKADDPRELRRQIADLQRQLRTQREVPKIERVEVPVLQGDQLEQIEELIANIASLGAQLTKVTQDLNAALTRVTAQATQPPIHPVAPPPQPKPHTLMPAETNTAAAPLRSGERRMLETLERRYPMKVTRSQLGTLSKFAPSGGTFTTYLSALKRAGLLEEVGGEITITRAGLDYLGAQTRDSPQTTEELLEMWRGALRAGERKMLDQLVELYPRSLSRAELAEQTGYEASGGTFGTYLGALRRNGLIEVVGDQVRASETLFLST